MLSTRLSWRLAIVPLLTLSCTIAVQADEAPKKPEFPPFAEVTKGYEEVKTSDGSTPFIRIWKRDKDSQLLGQLPKDYASSTHRQFIATTVSSGEQFAGLQANDHYVFWRKYGKRLALIRENLSVRGSDKQSKDSVNRIFTDRVMLDVPIVTMGPKGGPIIDLDALLVGNASTFFGPSYRVSNRNLLKIKKAKCFKKNIEVAIEAPMSGGALKTLHYSISKITGSPGFKPRPADERIGYFTTGYDDYGQYDKDDARVRMINRWHLEKRDPKLKLSPPKQPIVFYIEHTTPVRYRRWVREGVLYWNKAFEQVGILNAIEVRMQDKESNLYMDADPEDVQFNFIRWLNNNISTAIGPSRVNPLTGEILDADIVLTDGWIRVFESQFDKQMPKIAMQGATPETLAWYAEHPNWDPRIRMAAPGKREAIRQALAAKAALPNAGHSSVVQSTEMMGDEAIDGLIGRTSQVNGGCLAAEGRRYDVALMRMMMAYPMLQDGDDEDDTPKKKKKKKRRKKKVVAEDDDDASDDDESDDDDEDSDDEDDESDEDEDEKEEEKEKEQMLDGMPESFIGPLLADLVCHEVGHTLGLRHNFKASSIYTLKEINSEDHKGQKTLAGSVMDYLPTNFNFKSGKTQGDYGMIGVGPYDMWAIEYGYTLDSKKLPKILARVAEPELAYCTDQDTFGPDPLARRYDFSKDPLDFAKNQIRLAEHHREKILEDFVEDGDSWSKAQQGYLLTLRMQTSATSMMSNWIGGTIVRFDHKGDPGDRKPIEAISAENQRGALEFVLEHTMHDEAYGLTPELLEHMVASGWRDGGFSFDGPTWPVHDRVGSVQASALSSLMNPTVLRRVHDNEFRVKADEDVLTLNELLNTVSDSIWNELEDLEGGEFDERKPAISSLRRNLQAEHLERLFDLANNRSSIAAMKPISNLSKMKLTELQEEIEGAAGLELDAYTKAHLVDSSQRIKKWIESLYVTSS